MKSNRILFGMVLSIFSMVLISFNPVVGYVSIENEIRDILPSGTQDVSSFENVEYYEISYKKLDSIKEIIGVIQDDEIKDFGDYILEELDYYSFDNEYEKTIYIPIICETLKIVFFLSFIWCLILFATISSLIHNEKISDYLMELFDDIFEKLSIIVLEFCT